MTATYHRHGQGHSLRGRDARAAAAAAWSRLPTELRRGLTSGEAARLGISKEWHHAGKTANQVFVYYRGQVAAFWAVVDSMGVTVDDLRAAAAEASKAIVWGSESVSESAQRGLNARRVASRAAEAARCDLRGEAA